jgi:hypothetical protein
MAPKPDELDQEESVVHVDLGMELNLKKDDFLASKTNTSKHKFINMRSSSLEKSDCKVHQADCDADI